MNTGDGNERTDPERPLQLVRDAPDADDGARSLVEEALAAKLRAMRGDPDVDQIMAYLEIEMSVDLMMATEDRLAADETFRRKVAPLILLREHMDPPAPLTHRMKAHAAPGLKAQLLTGTPRQIIDLANTGRLEGLPEALQLRQVVRRRGNHKAWIEAVEASGREGFLGMNRQVWLFEQITTAARRPADADPLIAAAIERAIDVRSERGPALGTWTHADDLVTVDRRARAAMLYRWKQKTLAFLLATYPRQWYHCVRWGADPSRPEPIPDEHRPDRWGPDHPRVAFPLRLLRERKAAPPAGRARGAHLVGHAYLEQAIHPYFFGWLRAIEYRHSAGEVSAAERERLVNELLNGGAGLLNREDKELARLYDGLQEVSQVFTGTMQESFDDPAIRAASEAYHARERVVQLAALRRCGCEDLAQLVERDRLG